VFNDEGEGVAKGRLGDFRELSDGVYTVVCGPHQERVWITAGLTTRVIVNQRKLVR